MEDLFQSVSKSSITKASHAKPKLNALIYIYHFSLKQSLGMEVG